MNILFTCAGRRNYLISYFKEVLGPEEMVCASDGDEYASALIEADRSFVVPRIDDPAYISVLVRLCKENKIGLLIPLNDLELPLLARQRGAFLSVGTYPLVSSEEVVDICFDKWRTAEFCHKIGIGCPATFLTLEQARQAIENNEVAFPLVVKPRWGSASIGIEYVYDWEELEIVYKLTKRRIQQTMLNKASMTDFDHAILIQEKLDGKEFGVDVVNDLQGQYRTVFIRHKIAMRAGETDKAETVADLALTEIGRRIGENLRHIGNLDCDLFVTESGIRLLEMNPRFGGGYPFSHLAGANLPAAIVAWARGEEVKPEWLRAKPGVVGAKCERLVEVARGEVEKSIK